MSSLNKLMRHLNASTAHADRGLAEALDSAIESVDLSNSDEILVYTHKKNSLIKIRRGKFDIYGNEKDEESLRVISGLLISLLGWDEQAYPIQQSKLISFLGPLPDLKASLGKERAKLIIKAVEPPKMGSSSRSAGKNPKTAFSAQSETEDQALKRRADIWKSRGLQDVEIQGKSVWVTVNENTVIEDKGPELKLYGDYDLQAISLMVFHAKEQWNNNCYVDGDEAFKNLVWRECYIQGVNLGNYEPDEAVKMTIMSTLTQPKNTSHGAPIQTAA